MIPSTIKLNVDFEKRGWYEDVKTFIFSCKFEKYEKAIKCLVRISVYFSQQKFPNYALLEVLDFCKNGLEIFTSFLLVKSNRKIKKLFRQNLQNKSALKLIGNKYPVLKRKNKFQL